MVVIGLNTATNKVVSMGFTSEFKESAIFDCFTTYLKITYYEFR